MVTNTAIYTRQIYCCLNADSPDVEFRNGDEVILIDQNARMIYDEENQTFHQIPMNGGGGGGGGGGITLLDSGTYTVVSAGGTMTIPVSLTGTPVAVLVECDTETSGMAQSLGWAFANPAAFPDWSTKATYTTLADGPGARVVWVKLANGTHQFSMGSDTMGTVNTSNIVVKRSTSSYPILAGDYKWYVWGLPT